jgi:hypothetical protein
MIAIQEDRLLLGALGVSWYGLKAIKIRFFPEMAIRLVIKECYEKLR